MINPLARLHQFITTHYDREELIDLCFSLGVPYDDLAGERLSAKAREMLLHLGRRGQFGPLLVTLAQERPRSFKPADWPDATALSSLSRNILARSSGPETTSSEVTSR